MMLARSYPCKMADEKYFRTFVFDRKCRHMSPKTPQPIYQASNFRRAIRLKLQHDARVRVVGFQGEIRLGHLRGRILLFTIAFALSLQSFLVFWRIEVRHIVFRRNASLFRVLVISCTPPLWSFFRAHIQLLAGPGVTVPIGASIRHWY